jgi:hypothetical protein
MISLVTAGQVDDQQGICVDGDYFSHNTVEICALSERYREQVPGLDRTALGTGSAFRHGPEPEFFVLPDADATKTILPLS